MHGKTYKLNPLSEYVASLEDWELIEYISRYVITKKWLLTEASHATKEEIEKVWKSRYHDEPIPVLGCVPPLHCMSSIQNYLDELEKEGNKNE